MKLSRVAVISVSALALLAGVFLGLAPVRATLTQISPELRLLHVTCGNGYLRVTPPERPDALVELPGEPGVFVPRATYDEHCAIAAGWRRYPAWGLTALGALGLALTFAAGRSTPLPSPEAGGGAPAAKRGRGGVHRARLGGSGKDSGKVSGKDSSKDSGKDAVKGSVPGADAEVTNAESKDVEPPNDTTADTADTAATDAPTRPGT